MAKILIAEDDVVGQVIIRKLVEDMGHFVVLSPDGEHAYINLITNKDFDLLITDVKMPKMSGLELVEKLKSSAKFKKLPIIIISSVIGYNDISEILKTGAAYFVAKPLNIEHMRNYIERSLQK